MEKWAIVIGIDQYWIPEACLHAAVADAVKMFGWLTNSKGGAVPSRNIALLLSPSATSHSSPPGMEILPAKYDPIVESIEHLLKRSGGEGECLFFYFSGHGMTSRMDLSNESGIIFSDFNDRLTTKSLTVRSIFELFLGTRFQKQFFFIDACRNIPCNPCNREFRLGEYPTALRPVPPVPPQFIMFATSPGLKAVELHAAGYEGGAFTTALLEGLRGVGSAKEWSDEEYAYVVCWERLFRYVEEKVRGQRLRVETEDASRAALIQEPRQFGEHGGANPPLVRFPSNAFGPEQLDVNLEPEAIAHDASVTVGDLGGTIEQKSSIKTLPVRFSLLPKQYGVRAEAPSYRSEKPYYAVDLYGPKTVKIKLEPGQPLPPFSREATRGGQGKASSGTLEVSTADPFGRIEIRNTSGQLLSSGQGRVACREVLAGFYRASLRSPEGRVEEQLVAFVPSQTEPVALRAPILPEEGVLREVLQRAGIAQSADNYVEPSEAMGPISDLRLSTILGLAAGAASEATPYGGRLRRIGVRPFKSAEGGHFPSGVQVICGFENVVGREAADHVESIRLGLKKQPSTGDIEGQRLIPFGPVSGLGQAEWGATAGAYWLTIAMPEFKTIALPVLVLPGRLTLVIIHRDRGGKNHLFQYMPLLLGDEPNDPLTGLARFPVLRRSELMQRFAIAGRLDGPELSALELRAGKWVEPVAACVEALRLLKTRRYDELSDMTKRLTRDFDQLTDGWVLRAAHYQVREARNEAEIGYRHALQLGLPVLGECLDLLVRGVDDCGIEHPLKAFEKDLSARRLRAMLWTASYAADINALVPLMGSKEM